MNLEPVKHDPKKWIPYYKSNVGRRCRRGIQRGYGSLGPVTQGCGSFDVVSNKTPKTVATQTEQAVQQIRSEVKHRKTAKSLPPVH